MRKFDYVLLILTTVACAARYVGLEISPPGFYIDEAMNATNSLCFQQTMHDLFGRISLFSPVDTNYQAATFLMSSAAWTSVLGNSFFAYRAFMAFVGMLCVSGLWQLTFGITKNLRFALWTAFLAACLPWAFFFSRIFWEAPVALALLLWGLATLYYDGMLSARTFVRRDWIYLVAGSVLVALASYTYAPIRVQAALLLVFIPGFRWRERLTMLLLFGLMNIPMLWYFADPGFLARSKMLALNSELPMNPYHDASVFGLAWGFFKNMALHFSPSFLVLTGDLNLRHSIQKFGMLDYVTAAGVFIGVLTIVRRNFIAKDFSPGDKALAHLAVAGVMAGIIPAALTWEAIPHGIRSMGSWPFFVLVAVIGWQEVFKRFAKVQYVVVAVSVALFAWYLQVYFTFFPLISAQAFDAHYVAQIYRTETYPNAYGPVARAFYRMTMNGEKCADLQKEFSQPAR
jgi:hypothetical protein